MTPDTDRRPAEERFREVFAHLGAVTAYARRRGSRDADGIAAEAMSIAWRRLADVPRDDPLPWLYATARNLLLAERRASSRDAAAGAVEPAVPAPELHELDPPLDRALRSLGPADREALLLVAWEDLAPTQAARALGLNPTAFRVRLLRARRRLRAALDEERRPAPLVQIDVEGT
ncbi:MAG TPA: sigma factor-like helix-turn-helix DNA-binding protein [Gaiellaceae bacterium]|nr:sigma factor-like helix-turn-helix DNA-binding protein [Gaiellaceae bacterium]